jgi:hypothetical protein
LVAHLGGEEDDLGLGTKELESLVEFLTVLMKPIEFKSAKHLKGVGLEGFALHHWRKKEIGRGDKRDDGWQEGKGQESWKNELVGSCM